MPNVRTEISTWLLRQSLIRAPADILVEGLAHRLNKAGLQVDRMATGSLVLHPMYAANVTRWDSETQKATHFQTPRHILSSEQSRNSPFHHIATAKERELRCRLDGSEGPSRFEFLRTLQAEGHTDYLLLFEEAGSQYSWMDALGLRSGVNFSLSTKRPGGFTDAELQLVRDLLLPVATAINVTNVGVLSRTILDTYLGGYSGGHVLEGRVQRGDAELIECVLWYCDMRDSTPLADAMPMEGYFEMVNTYLDCTAGAVLDAGGEVLRIIGDAVFAIFPLGEKASGEVQAQAAADAALQAVANVNAANRDPERGDRPPIRFGIGLHAGQVMYGNVGTARRLEFSVTGPAANEVARLEGLCKKLREPVLASSAFHRWHPRGLIAQGHHIAAGVEGGLEVFSLPVPS
jgi:adenylate cyclase